MATLQRQRTDLFPRAWNSSDAVSSVPQSARIPMNVFYEIGSELVAGSIRQESWVEPSDAPTLVLVSSKLVKDAVRRRNSPEYLASIRRRKSLKIKNMLASLAKKAPRDDFEVFAFRLIEEIRELLIQL